MTLHMRSLGITVEEIGTLYGIVPFFGIIINPGMGMIADKIGNFKVRLIDSVRGCGFIFSFFSYHNIAGVHVRHLSAS